MATVKNEVLISLLHENFYLVGKELTFGGGRNCSRCRVNEQIFHEWGDYPYPPVGKTLLICIYIYMICLKHIIYIYIYIYIYAQSYIIYITYINL